MARTKGALGKKTLEKLEKLKTVKTITDTLDGFDLHLRKLMHSIKAYAVSEQLCKRIRKYDRKHLKWRKEISKIHKTR